MLLRECRAPGAAAAVVDWQGRDALREACVPRSSELAGSSLRAWTSRYAAPQPPAAQLCLACRWARGGAGRALPFV